MITLNVDGKSNLKIMKKKSVGETSTKDPLYLGGVPKDVKLRGLNTVGELIYLQAIIAFATQIRN